MTEVFKSYHCYKFTVYGCDGYFKKNTALYKSQATNAVKARIRVCKFFWRALRDITCTLPRSLSAGKVADKRTTNEEHFRLRKFVSRGASESSCQRAECKLACNYKRAQPKFAKGNDFSLRCAFCTLLGAKRVG